jgi:hypothetical protein
MSRQTRPRPAEQIEYRAIERLIPDANNAGLRSEADLDTIAAARTVNQVDQKTYWGLGEVVMWIRTGDYERVAALSDLSETEAMERAMFTLRMPMDARSLSRFSTTNCEANREAAAPPDKDKAADIEWPGLMPPDTVFDDVIRKLRSGCLPLTATKHGRDSDEQIPVPSAELNDLVFRFIPDHPIAQVGLWSRSRRLVAWRSPQFSRSDVVRVWPARNTKTAAVPAAILRHLREIMIPEAPLTKSEAQRRCMTEVPNAYPAAFKKAWMRLEPFLKRGRGKHGSRAH